MQKKTYLQVITTPYLINSCFTLCFSFSKIACHFLSNCWDNIHGAASCFPSSASPASRRLHLSDYRHFLLKFRCWRRGRSSVEVLQLYWYIWRNSVINSQRFSAIYLSMQVLLLIQNAALHGKYHYTTYWSSGVVCFWCSSWGCFFGSGRTESFCFDEVIYEISCICM